MIENIIITSLALYGAGLVQSQGMVLHGLRRWLDAQPIPFFIRKPLYACPPCMTSLWGSVVWFFLCDTFFSIHWPLFCFSVCGFTYLLIYNFPYDE